MSLRHDAGHIEGGSGSTLAWQVLVHSDLSFLAQSSLCTAGQIGPFDVFASERVCSGPAMHCFLWEWQDEILQGVIRIACTRVCSFSNTVCSLKEAENMTCPKYEKNVYKRFIKILPVLNIY